MQAVEHTEVKSFFQRVQRNGLILAVVGAVLWGIGTSMNGQDRFWQSYLYAFIFWSGLSLGGLACLLLHHIVAGAWGFLIQRIIEAVTRTLPLAFLLFLPIALIGQSHIYEWHPVQLEAGHHDPAGHSAAGSHEVAHVEETGDASHGEESADASHDEESAETSHGEASAAGGHDAEAVKHAAHVALIKKKAWFLSPSKYVTYGTIYFAIWIAMMFVLNRWSLDLQKTGNERRVIQMRSVGSVGMVVYFFTMTFAATQWTMSLDAGYASTMYAPIFIVGHGLSILAFSVIILSKVKNHSPISDVYNIELVHHLGNLMLAFTVLWAYTTFMSYLITWSANVAEFIPWYIRRSAGGWTTISLILMAFHFAVPFFILLWRRSKRSIGFLKKLAVYILLMRLVDFYWLITPEFSREGFRMPHMEIFGLMAIGGIWLWFFAWQIQQRPLLMSKDPRQLEAFVKWEGAADHG
jgi:hypothetical protein